MKKELIISIIITVVVIIGVLISSQQPENTSTTTPTIIDTSTTQTTVSTRNAVATITKTDVAKHNKATDCWIIIDQNAYNVTSYLNAHPGGRAIIIQMCGKDATTVYNAIRGGSGHSSRATRELSSLFVSTVQ